MKKLEDVMESLRVARAEDLPYMTSPPIQFVYRSTATLGIGMYLWNDAPTALTPNRPILENALYFFRSVTFGADVEELDFTSNIVTVPQFFMFREADARVVMFREPVLMNMFYEQFEYRFFWHSQRVNDQLYGAFRGTLVQGPTLIGKLSITLNAVISAQEIVDEEFISLFKTSYPKLTGRMNHE